MRKGKALKLRNFYFVLRHGETPYQAERKKTIYPWPEFLPILLTEKGKKQIRLVAEKLKKEKIDFVYSSDISRARQTAEIVAKELGLPVNLDTKLRDINFGIYHGKPKKEFYQHFLNPMQRFYKKPRNGESWSGCQKRITDVLKDIDKKYKNKKILIVSHRDPLWLLEGTIKGWSKKQLLWQKFTKRAIKAGELRRLSVLISA